MEYFWYTSDNIPKGLGFAHFSPFHLAWIFTGILITVLCCILYRRLGQKGRGVFRKTVALLLVADELFKLIPMVVMGVFRLDYLPFQLCSINLFLIGWHAWKPGKLLDNFLYTVCIPGAVAAMLFPTWTKLPAVNYMLIHSFTVHILLVLYPVVLTAAGEIKPELKEVPKCLLLLAALAAVALVLNLLWDTNFMFLMSASKGNRLYWFGQHWGNHLLGFPVLIAAVILVMHIPWCVARKVKIMK